MGALFVGFLTTYSYTYSGGKKALAPYYARRYISPIAAKRSDWVPSDRAAHRMFFQCGLPPWENGQRRSPAGEMDEGESRAGSGVVSARLIARFGWVPPASDAKASGINNLHDKRGPHSFG
jgi:hypothetical protein